MAAAKLTERLDALYEFDREPVRPDRFQGLGSFLGMYAGEHVAGTEFVIGPLFVSHGVTAADFFLGLLAGNALAVLSWAFCCAPVAVRTRLTFYWQLRKICGPGLNFAYCIVNALMWCILAGAMIGVSATAVGLPFGIPMPGLNDLYPNSAAWIAVVFGVGTVVVTLAILGFERIARFSRVCAPWMALVFIAAALAVLPRLGCESASDFWRVANERIWTGTPYAGQSRFGFFHVLFFAWFCNLAWHIGMGDMSILRYARRWWYGFASFAGMFLGHFIAWICSGILCAAAAGDVAPGPIAYAGAGVAGAVCVVVAGWTTANPTLYRAGLAFQVITPDWARWKVTLAAGAITTVAACFPALVMRLLDFVAAYGLVLMPMGVVILADHWLLPLIGLRPNHAEATGATVNWAAAATWIVTVAVCMALRIEIFFKSFPGILLALVLYVGSVAFSPDARRMAIGAADPVLALWDTASWTPIHAWAGHSNQVRALAFSPDGRILASGSWDTTIRLWDTTTADELGVLEGSRGIITCLAFSPDGTTLASASAADNDLKLWDLASGKERTRLSGHTGTVNSLAYSPDGMILASGAMDRTTRLWYLNQAKHPEILPDHAPVLCVSFSPDGRILATGSACRVRLWRSDPAGAAAVPPSTPVVASW